MLRIEMLDEHEAEPSVRRKTFEQFREGFEAARRGANACDGEGRSIGRWIGGWFGQGSSLSC